MNGSRLAFRRWLSSYVPAGVASGPFEFAVAIGYLIASVRILADRAVFAHFEQLLFPDGGFLAWVLLLLASSAMIIFGQLTAASRVPLGLHCERLGLVSLSVALIGYLYAVWSTSGGVSVAVETVGATLLACLYKSAQIHTALEGMRRQGGGEDGES